MATFGQGINANLGAIDYSAYQRGAAQGAQSIGQGLAGLGQGIGVVVKERKEYKNNVASAKKLIAGLNTLNIPDDVKKQMGVLGAQIDDPNISLSEQSAIATRLSSLADGIVGAGLKQSFEDAKNKRISDAINAATTKQTPEQSINSFNATLAGKTEPAFQPRVNMSKLDILLGAGMSAADIAALQNAQSNETIASAKGVNLKTPYEIALLKAKANAADRSNNDANILPQVFTDPTSKKSFVIHKNTILPITNELKNQIPDFVAIDELVAKKQMTEEKGLELKTKILQKHGDWSPNQLPSLMAALGQIANNGSGTGSLRPVVIDFSSEDDANQAGASGKLKKGQQIKIGTKTFTWE